MERLGDADTRTGVPCREQLVTEYYDFYFNGVQPHPSLTEGDTEKTSPPWRSGAARS